MMADQQQNREQEAAAESGEKEESDVYKTKSIQFLGRTTPIILQNDNGPCPLLAICNVLLLRNQLNLPDNGEVSQEKLLSLVAERLIDSNSNNKDAGYVENQQQNIADAIDLLPRLATGIDVNIKFRRIDDFEFTRECAIFDLLDIPLYHGWIVDPQDPGTATAIESKSYNALMGELVALETQYGESACKTMSREDSVDFAAATTAALGVPSPCLGKSSSFGDPPQAATDQKSLGKGDHEEEEELLRALKLSVDINYSASIPHQHNVMEVYAPLCSDQTIGSADPVDTSEGVASAENIIHHQREPSLADGLKAVNVHDSNEAAVKTISGDDTVFSLKSDEKNYSLLYSEEAVEKHYLGCGADKSMADPPVHSDSAQSVSSEIDPALKVVEKRNVNLEGNKDDKSTLVSDVESCHDNLQQFKYDHSTLTTDAHEDNQIGNDVNELVSTSTVNADSDSSIGNLHHSDVAENLTSSVDGSEPIYEGEDCISDPFEDREPIYEGEVILAEQADKSTINACKVSAKGELTPQQGELIKNFLKNSASQLTFYGLFCLRDGLKERELCVFFRNNHFSTMFKYNGELYLLATDQGYINQPDLVWEKLNEVNGDTLFMTGYFKEFKMECNANGTWDEQNAMTSTADYLASINNMSQAGLDMNSDLQLAIQLQQQEFEQQPEPQNQQSQNRQQTSGDGTNRLIVGPEAPRKSGRSSSSTSQPPEPKSKEKCTMM